jgi:hypothetical protein
MKIKGKLLALLLAAAAVFTLTGCRDKTDSGASSPAAKDYAAILRAARSAEDNENNLILAPDGLGGYTATDGFSADLSADDVSAQADMLLPLLNLKAEDMDAWAVSASLMNVRSYAVAIVKPAEGRADAVRDGLQAYVDAQKANMETYLPDQYEIAKDAKIVTADSGEVILVCCENAPDVLASIEAGLKAQ